VRCGKTLCLQAERVDDFAAAAAAQLAEQTHVRLGGHGHHRALLLGDEARQHLQVRFVIEDKALRGREQRKMQGQPSDEDGSRLVLHADARAAATGDARGTARRVPLKATKSY